MPELPEVQALVDFLTERIVDDAITAVELGSFSVLKTYAPAPQAFDGLVVSGVGRHGKFVDIDCDGLHLIFHLAKAGWLRWYDEMPRTALRPNKSPVAVRVRLASGGGFDLTEAGTRKSLAAYIVADPPEVPGIARLGPDPLADAFTLDAFAALLGARNAQIKGVLRDQSVIAGIGNAYSDEILHTAKLSPYAVAGRLKPEQVDDLHAAMTAVLADAVARSAGQGAATLKGEKRSGLRVHARTGLPCPVCGDTVREVSFADRSFQYCPGCQTGGRPLADRRLSRLVR